MIQFKLNGKKIQFPSSWDDLTFNQYFQIMESKSDGELLSICLGMDTETLKKAKFEGLESVLMALSFTKKPAVWDQPTLKCGKYNLPINHKGQYNIQYESLGQFEDARAIMSKFSGKGVVEMARYFPDLVSIYLQKVRDGEYSLDKAQEMVPEIKEMPAREVVTLGSFFIVKLSNLLTGTQANSQSTPLNPKKSKPVLKGSSRRLARSPRSRK